MLANDIVALLEVEWDNIQAKLSQQEWEQFSTGFARITGETEDDAESFQRAVCEVMENHEYTRYLIEYLKARQSESVRGLGAPSTIGDRVEVRAIRNRLRHLSNRDSRTHGLRDSSSSEPPGEAKNGRNRDS